MGKKEITVVSSHLHVLSFLFKLGISYIPETFLELFLPLSAGSIFTEVSVQWLQVQKTEGDDVTPVWDRKPKTTDEQTRQTLPQRAGQQGEGGEQRVKGQIHGDGRRFDFGGWAPNATHRGRSPDWYARNLCALVHQRHPHI